MTRAPEFSVNDSPAAIVTAGGQWLAEELGDGFAYIRSKNEVRRELRQGRREAVVLQSSTRSRTGQGTWVSPRISVTDLVVLKWQADRRIVGLFGRGGHIFDSMIINLGFPLSIELFGPLRAIGNPPFLSLGEFRDAMASSIRPNLEILRGEPRQAAEQLPDSWLAFAEPLVWWSAAYGDREAAQIFLTRYFGLRPGGLPSFERGRRIAAETPGVAPEPSANAALDFGWSVVATGVLDADAPI